MKYFVVVLVTFLASVSAMDQATKDEMKAKHEKMVKACAAEAHASADDLAALASHTIPASHEGKCLIFCMHKLYKIQNDDGAINLEGGLATLEMLKDINVEAHGKLVTVFKNCASSVVVDGDPCITAANWGECAMREGKAIGLDKCMFE